MRDDVVGVAAIVDDIAGSSSAMTGSMAASAKPRSRACAQVRRREFTARQKAIGEGMRAFESTTFSGSSGCFRRVVALRFPDMQRGQIRTLSPWISPVRSLSLS